MFRYNYEYDTLHHGRMILKLRFTFKYSIDEIPIIETPEPGLTIHTYHPKYRTDCIITQFNGLDSNGREKEENYGSANVYCYFKDQFNKKVGRQWALKKAIEGFPRENRTEIWSIFNRMSKQGTCEKLVDGMWQTVAFNKLQKNDIFTLKFGNKYGLGHHVCIAVAAPNLTEDSHGNKIWGIESIPFTLTNISSTFIKMVAEQFSPDAIMRMIAEAQHEWK